MRLGTKSCSECRRRKIRCVFSPGNSVCQSCSLHDTLCNAQQPRIVLNAPENGNTVLQQRINGLEGLVKSLAATVGVAIAPNEDVNEETAQSAPSSTADAGWPSPECRLSVTNPSDAPLINLFRNALLISDADGRIQDHGGNYKASIRACGRELSTNLSPYIPDEPTIRSILRTTQKYWCTWPTCYYGPEPDETFQVDRDSEGEEYIVKRLTNQYLDTGFCIAFLWLALCIQQLPMDEFRSSFPKSPSKQDLITSYLAYCKLILAGTDMDMEDLDAVQCHLLQYKLYINMGMPQKAWNGIRSAVSIATQLGLNKLTADDKESHRMIWLQSWITERQLSLVLGYPSAVQTDKTQFGSLPMGLHGPVAYRILHALALVYGDVINRDQGYINTSYSTTIKIDEDLEELRRLFPVEWWDPSSLTNGSLMEFYYREVTKFLYFLLVKFVHLPYMLRSIHDIRYEHSRQSVLDAAREQIRCYVRLRNFPGAEILVCELMDFNVFSAGMALIIGTLYMPSHAQPLNILTEDGSLIESLIASLRQTALLLDCPVADQGARVLELLINRSPSAADEQVELTVPYFGKLKIKMPELNDDAGFAPSTASQPSSVSGQTDNDFSSTTSATVEFSTNDFASSVARQFKQGDELRTDWFGVFDTSSCYSWQHTLTRMQIDG